MSTSVRCRSGVLRLWSFGSMPFAKRLRALEDKPVQARYLPGRASPAPIRGCAASTSLSSTFQADAHSADVQLQRVSSGSTRLRLRLKHSGLMFSESPSWQQQYRPSAAFIEMSGVCCNQRTTLMLLRSFLCLAGTCRLRELSNSSRDASRAAVFGCLAETGLALPFQLSMLQSLKDIPLLADASTVSILRMPASEC